MLGIFWPFCKKSVEKSPPSGGIHPLTWGEYQKMQGSTQEEVHPPDGEGFSECLPRSGEEGISKIDRGLVENVIEFEIPPPPPPTGGGRSRM